MSPRMPSRNRSASPFRGTAASAAARPGTHAIGPGTGRRALVDARHDPSLDGRSIAAVQSSKSPQVLKKSSVLRTTGRYAADTGWHGTARELPGQRQFSAPSAEVVTVSRPVSGILCQRSRRRGDHPSVRPTRGCPSRDGRAARAPCLALLRVGVAEPPGSPRTLVRSYRTVSPLPVTGEPGHRRSALCCPIRQVAPTWLSPAPCPVESRLSSTRSPTRRPRPPGRLTVSRSVRSQSERASTASNSQATSCTARQARRLTAQAAPGSSPASAVYS